MVRIEKVLDTYLYKKGLKEGFYIKKVNGKNVEDILDILFNSSEKNKIVYVNEKNKENEVTINEELLNKIVFEGIKPKKCGCKCIFCFVDQLPKGMRKTLNYKDEDYRLSYISGNYVTLANLTKKDFEKIIRYKLSPLYISVHSTEPEIRSKMLGLKKPSDIMALLKELAKNGIKMHTQIVLCPGINDGKILKKTVQDLSSLYPYVETVAIVPVGLTSHRDNLFKLRPVTKEISDKIFNLINPLQTKFIKRFNTPFVYLSDEFFLLSNKEIPDKEFYDDFSQIENGVGLVRYFIDDAERTLKRKLKKLFIEGKIIIPTGVLIYDKIVPFIKKLSKLIDVQIELVSVENNFFGDRITVTGLLTGIDIITTLKGKKFKYLLVPDVMLRDRKDYFLDDISLKELSKILSVKVYKFMPLLSELYKTLLKIEKKEVNYDKR